MKHGPQILQQSIEIRRDSCHFGPEQSQYNYTSNIALTVQPSDKKLFLFNLLQGT